LERKNILLINPQITPLSKITALLKPKITSNFVTQTMFQIVVCCFTGDPNPRENRRATEDQPNIFMKRKRER
jgi:hypothetical protein